MSPRLRSNWRAPARQPGAQEDAAEEQPNLQSAENPAPRVDEAPAVPEGIEPAANEAEPEAGAAAPPPPSRPRVRRTPTRTRAPAAPGASTEAEATGETETPAAPTTVEAAEARPRRRQPVRRRSTAAEPETIVAEPEAARSSAFDLSVPATPLLAAPLESPETTPDQEFPESVLTEPPAAAESASVLDEPEPAWAGELLAQARADGEAAWSAVAADLPVEPAADLDESQSARAPRRRGQRGRRGRGGRIAPATEGMVIQAEPEPTVSAPRSAAPEYEPLPPPTKRKAPRVIPGMRPQRPAASTENAVDWALGRAPAQEAVTVTPAPAPAPEEAETALGIRRRRSRRGRGGRAPMNGTPPITGTPSIEAGEAEEPAALVSEEQFITAQQRRQQAPPARDDRGRSQLSTFESLVARQNVVLDTLLARVSSFGSIERALNAVEHRLSSQGFGATGSAAPRVGIFVDVPNIIYAAERIGVTIDFGKLLRLLTHGRELVRASAYSPISDDPMQRLDVQKFVQPFVRGGYRIVTKPLKRFSDGTMKGNFDVELAIDILTMAERLDVVSLVSGDGDFSRLVDIVGSKGVRVEVAAFGGSTSAELRAICDDYIDLGNILPEIT